MDDHDINDRFIWSKFDKYIPDLIKCVSVFVLVFAQWDIFTEKGV